MKRIAAQRYGFAILLPMAVLGATATVQAGAQNADFKGFPDVPKTHWAYQAVTELAQKGILQGYPAKKKGGKLTFNAPMKNTVASTPNKPAAVSAVSKQPQTKAVPRKR